MTGQENFDTSWNERGHQMATAQKEQKQSKNRMGMNVRLLSPKDIQSVWLPVQPKGKYYFQSDKGVRNDSVYIEAEGDHWTAHSDQRLWIIENREKKHSVALEKGNYYPIIDDHDNQVFAFYCEGTDDTQNQFDVYSVADPSEIRIGRSSSNDIIYENPFASRQHAVLSYSNGKWAVRDLDSLAGVFLSTERIYVKPATLGDVLYIIGLRIIIGTDFIAVSNESWRNGSPRTGGFLTKEPRRNRLGRAGPRGIPYSGETD